MYIINFMLSSVDHEKSFIASEPGCSSDMSGDVRKPDFCICENKAADQLCSSRTADQRLCFRYIDSTITLLPKSEISSL